MTANMLSLARTFDNGFRMDSSHNKIVNLVANTDRLSRCLLSLAREKRRYAAHGNAPVCPFRLIRRNFQILFTISLRGEVFRRHSELLCQRDCDRLRAAVRQGQIVYICADRG
jgi:hypothetical protein